MKILLVVDQYYAENNGVTVSARRFAQVLTDHGHEIRVLTCREKANLKDSSYQAYLVPKLSLPGFNHLIAAQGMTIAKPDKDVVQEAVEWADLVHFLLPFPLARCSVKMAKKLGKPYTGAFHVQAENITSSLHLAKFRFANSAVYHFFYRNVYHFCQHIHCPSNFIASELKKRGYKKQKMHVISNGIDPDFVYRKIPKSEEFAGKFTILMIGRLSVEKRQNVLIRGIKKSRYADRIQLVLAGKGPKEKRLRRKGKKLPHPVHIEFFSKPDLLDMIAMSDLYVHAANMEIEAMSCMEAFASGLVPVIANSKKSATPQFALDDRSLFKAGNSRDLARKIDYWIEHEDERKEMEHAYSGLGQKYQLEDCVRQAEQMFENAVIEQRSH